MGRHQDLVDCARLLVRSLYDDNDALFSFLSTWSALEIFVNRSFRTYEKLVLEKLCQGGTPTAPSEFVERIRDVMRDKYGLSNKFALIASELDAGSAEGDTREFKRIKKIRDKLMHGEDVSLQALPIKDTLSLLRKYLRLYVEHLTA